MNSRVVDARKRSARVAKTERSKELRWGWRKPCRARVRIVNADGASGSGHLRDVSLSGAFLETSLSLALNSTITVHVRRDESRKGDIVMNATVMRLADNGAGVEWLDVAGDMVCEQLGCAERCAAEETGA